MATASLVGLALLMAIEVAGAQGRGRRDERGRSDDARGRASQGIPPGHLPPPGQCRVWYDDRPPGQQPAPTWCGNARAIAVRDGARVIFGDGQRTSDRDRVERRRDDERRRADDRYEDDRYDDDRDDGDRYDDRDDVDDRRRDRKCDKRKKKRDRKCDYDYGYDVGRGDDRFPDRDRNRDRDRFPGGTYPRSLPEMVWGVVFGRGERTDEVRRWTGAMPVRATFSATDRNGTPRLITWTGDDGRPVQRWFDDDGDGRADRVAVIRNDQIVRVIR